MRGSWRPNRTATYWPPLLWPSVFLFRSPGLLNRGPGGSTSLGDGFLYHVLSPTGLVSKLPIGGPEGPFCWVLVFSTTSYLQTRLIPNCSLNFPCTELYNHSMPPQSLMHFRRLWNGMFDRHRAEITVMQFTSRSLPVRQFVTVPWDFSPIPYCQPSSPTPMEYATSASLEWHVWLGRRSIYYISTQFSSIWPTNRTLPGAITPKESGPGSNDNEEVLCIP